MLNTDYDLTTIPSMKLLRICSSFEIPEAFDAVNLIDQLMPMLMGQIETKSAEEQEALECILGKASADIPFIIECDDVSISGKLNAKYLREELPVLTSTPIKMYICSTMSLVWYVRIRLKYLIR